MLAKSKSRMINYSSRVFVTISFVIALFMMLSFTRSYSKPLKADQKQNQFSGNRSENISEFDSNLYVTIPVNTQIKKSGFISNQAKIEPQNVVKGFVVNKYGKYIEGSTIIVSGKNSGVVTDVMGHFILSKVAADDSLTFSYKGYISQTVKPVFTSEMVIRFIIENESSLPKEEIISTYLPNFESNPLIIIDSVPVPGESMFNIDPTNQVSSLNILKGKEATDRYGEKGKNGIIEIFTIGNTFGNSEKTRSETQKVEKLLVVDGVISSKKLDDIPAENVDIVRVLGNFQAIKKYGEQGKNGAIEIVTKNK